MVALFETNEIGNSRKLPPDLVSRALRLSRLFGNSSVFWLNAQNAFDLWHAERRYQKVLDNVRLLKAV